ncbi:unnamed protein product [Cuscuta campestris]|uniref:Retrotransposon Copia-like N-terminal domain-containing protein n=1 Tax=Cuscuta campestris TaxID=132261 RepID=A0A484K4D9_9ASTE|nr:unnamed protein product [Cuscuta campestris]
MSSSITKDTPVIQLHAKTHFPIKLVSTNFPIWQRQRQVRSTLIGLDLLGYVDGSLTAPPQTVADAVNPCYGIWFRQDQAIVGALLGSCTDTIQPLISNVATSREAWLNLHSSFASASRGHVLALKSKLGKNPRGNRSINDYLHDMQSISNELALNQNPIKDEDLVAHVLNQLGSEYDPISSAAFIRGSAISFPELGDILRDFEHKLQVSDTAVSSMVATANSTQRHSVSNSRFNGGHSSTAPIAYPRRGQQHLGSGRQTRRQDGAHSSCQFCSIPGHDIKVCRKLARLLRDNGLQAHPTGPSVPVAHMTAAAPVGLDSLMFDSGASHHTTPNPQQLHSLSDYGGPDEIRLGNDLIDIDDIDPVLDIYFIDMLEGNSGVEHAGHR